MLDLDDTHRAQLLGLTALEFLNRKAEELLSRLHKTPGELLGKNPWEEFPELISTQAEEVMRAYAAMFDVGVTAHEEDWVLLSGVRR